MSTEIKQKTVDVAITAGPGGKLEGRVVAAVAGNDKTKKALRLHFSLMGDTSPSVSRLCPDYSIDDKTPVYRYDWMVGVTSIEPFYVWNWFEGFAAERAMVVQLLLDPGGSNCGVSESNAFLLGMQPSKDTASWAERNSEKLGDSLTKLSDITEPFSKIASTVLKSSAVMSNFILSGEKGDKHWFMYRFFDEQRKCCAVEWNINRVVIHRYGPVLRGSILLAFHGIPKASQPMTLLLRPRLNFGEGIGDFMPPFKELEATSPVALLINPVAANDGK